MVGKSSTKLEKAALDAALALKKGEVSSVVEGTQGYYIIYCVNDKEEDATQARKEVIIAKRQNRLFQRNITSGSISAMLISVKILGLFPVVREGESLKAEHVNPFIISVCKVMKDMCMLDLKIGGHHLLDNRVSRKKIL